MTDDWVTLARLTRARGIRGEVAASFASPLNRFSTVDKVFLRAPSGAVREARLERVWEHKGAMIFKFAGLDTRNDAETLEGAEVCVPAAERAPLEPDEYYHSDLAGCRVEDPHGRLIGAVRQVIQTGGADVLELDNGVMIPLNKAICTRIEPAAGRIVAELPEGLEELNRS